MKTFIYCCRLSRGNKGVKNKIENIVKAIDRCGYESDQLIVSTDGIFGHLLLAWKLFLIKQDIVLIRATPFTMYLMLPGLLYLRLIKKIIIVDVPTPFSVVVEEVKGSDDKAIVKIVKILIMYLTLPASLWPAHRVLQYSQESNWFMTGLNKKIREVGNGFSVKDVSLIEQRPEINGVIKFTGVALLAFWHGYDRFIRSMHEYKKMGGAYTIKFNVVGEGQEKAKLEKLVNELGLEEDVVFHGYKKDSDLKDVFEDTHIGLCSLGLSRKNLHVASELKAREYAARGIPFILGCKDFDFNDGLDFVYQVANDESNIDFNKIISWYIELVGRYSSFTFIRDFALKNIDFEHKVRNDILSADRATNA